jgi:hypothetical protein
MVELVTGEFTTHPNQALIDEYNKIHNDVNKRGICHYTLNELLQLHSRFNELREVLVIEQLSLF